MERMLRSALVGAVALAALAGCATPATDAAPATSEAQHAHEHGHAHGQIDSDTGEVITSEPVATLDADARTSAEATADQAMRAYARPTLDAQTWWTELSALMTQQARQDYQYVQPSAIPANAITGPAALTDDTSAYVVHVDVPTNAGIYTVILTRQDGASSWLVARITPPMPEA
ncbi:hypothetical protein [Pseudoclavibacter sp. RFBA6]|uniref:hypothetical protein n=1 Tax=Pseudoclavibacter sp. RFBA6 TaxID=2080573 RepID=UPI000CE7F8CB|nr:hypothetical protein [Pseudoclavibacter sp. RFBA6]